MAAGGKEMLQDIYKDYLLPESEWDQDFDLTLRIDLGTMPKTQKIKKSMDEAEAEKVREENEQVRLQRKALIEPVADRLSEFKKDFLSAPIRRAFKAALEGKIVEPVEIPYRQDEKYWVIMPANNEIQIFFAVNFSN
jgi:hypothetical protein